MHQSLCLSLHFKFIASPPGPPAHFKFFRNPTYFKLLQTRNLWFELKIVCPLFNKLRSEYLELEERIKTDTSQKPLWFDIIDTCQHRF